MKTVIIGGVAAGTKTAAKLKREMPESEVIIYTKSKDISYAGCGLPYYIGGDVESSDELTVNTPESFSALTGVKVVTEAECTAVCPENKTVTINGESVSYDKLVIASGASPFVPEISGLDLDGVFCVRTIDDAVKSRAYIEANSCKKAVVVGGGFIGLEVAENLLKRKMDVTVVDMADQIMPGIFDIEIADKLKSKLQDKGVRFVLSNSITGITGETKASGVTTNYGSVKADIVFLSIGIRANTSFLAGSGIELSKGTVVVNDKMETNIPDIYACGDCAVVHNRVSGKPQYSAMGSTANISGRILAQNISGKNVSYHGVNGTAIVKLADDLSASKTGFTEAQAKAENYDVITVLIASDIKPHYMPESTAIVIKVIGDRKTGKLLGMQCYGENGVDTMADIASACISMGATVYDIIDMDFAYSPVFSTAIHPFAQACTVLSNKMEGRLTSITPYEYSKGSAKDYTVIDASPKPAIANAVWVDAGNIEETTKNLDKSAKYLIVCAKGRRAYITYVKMKALGFENIATLEGGVTFNTVRVAPPAGEMLPEAEIKRVKGLGCLRDKRFNDAFNVRVITKNGKLTTEQFKAVSDAAEMFGSGEVTMTTRLTLEIQCVRYANLDALFDYLKQYGLETGGTGSLVRPVVSCKGTTCQYGLIDTFDLSEKLHEIYYKGWHTVTLPHKFKIAVGGCPNNCVKPDLNDLGIIGQRVPVIDYSKCRGCKVCQVENSCPIKIAHVADGKINIDDSECNHCGRCIGKCPFKAIEDSVYGYKVYIGGRWGKRVASGQPLSKVFTTEEEVIAVVEKALLIFRDEGITGERFSDTINRLGFDYVEDKLLNAEINKEEIMSKTVKGGATC